MSRARAPRVAAAVAVLAMLLAGCSGSAAAPDAREPAGPADPTRQATSYVVPPCPKLSHQAAVQGGLPDLTLPCLGGGRSVRLADLRGTPTVLSVWAAWCAICSKEMPVLAEGMRTAGDRLRFFGVHYKAPEKYGERSAKDFGVAFPSVQDTDGDRTTLALRPLAGPPQTFFYAADGTLRGRHVGAVTTRAQLQDLLHRYFGLHL